MRKFPLVLVGFLGVAWTAWASGAPTHEGRTSVQAVVGQEGAVFELGKRVKLILPRGLPIGNSRLLTLSTTKRRPKSTQIGKGFLPVGATLRFDGALDASDRPVELTVKVPKVRNRRGYRMAAAVEHPGLCTDENRRHRLSSGLCSTWTLHRASYFRGQGIARAPIPVTGGLRIQFGLARREQMPKHQS